MTLTESGYLLRPLFADAKDLVDRELLSFVFRADSGTFLDHCDGIKAKIFCGNQLRRSRKPGIEQDVIRRMAGIHSSLQQLDHDIGSL